jgi:hypothetical protein
MALEFQHPLRHLLFPFYYLGIRIPQVLGPKRLRINLGTLPVKEEEPPPEKK